MESPEDVRCEIVWNWNQISKHLISPFLVPGVGLLILLVSITGVRGTNSPQRLEFFAVALSWFVALGYFVGWRGGSVAWRITVKDTVVRVEGLFGGRDILGNSFRSAGHRSLSFVGGKVRLAEEYDDLRAVLDAIEQRFPEVPPLRPF